MSEEVPDIYSSSQNESPIHGNSPKMKIKKGRSRKIEHIPFPEDSLELEGKTENSSKFSEGDTSLDAHLLTRKMIKEKRDKFGSGWLLQAYAMAETPTVPSSQDLDTEQPHILLESEIYSSPQDPLKDNTSEAQNELTILCDVKKEETEEVLPTSANEIYSSPLKSHFSFEDYLSDVEDETQCELFLAYRHSSNQELMLMVGSSSLVEQDGMTGRKLCSLHLCNLLSAESYQEEDSTCILLRFDAQGKEKQERVYRMDSPDSAQKFLSLLYPALSKNAFDSAAEGALKCLNCEAEFSNNVVEHYLIHPSKDDSVVKTAQGQLKKVNKCPNCGGTFLLEIEEKSRKTPIISLDSPKQSPKPLDSSFLDESLNQNSSLRPRSVSVSKKPCVPEESSSTSSSSIECILAATDDGGEKSTLRSQSDITVLSNPSQSSFAVLSHSGSSVASSESRNIPEKDAIGHYFNNTTSRPQSSPVDIMYPASSLDQQWCDSSSVNTTVLQSSPKTYYIDKPSYGLGTADSSSEVDKLQANKDQRGLKLWEELEQDNDFENHSCKISHQVSLHLEVNVFQPEEKLLASVKANIVLESSPEEVSGNLIISTERFFLYRCEDGEEGSGIHEIEQQPLKNLAEIFFLLGNQGFGLSFTMDPRSRTTYLIILKDADICNSFVGKLQDILKGLLKNWADSCQPSFQHLTKESIQNMRTEIFDIAGDGSDQESKELDMFLMGTLRKTSDDSVNMETPVAFVVTSDHLYVVYIVFFKEPKNPAFHFKLVDSQHITNLTHIHLSSDRLCASFHFSDDNSGKEVFWIFRVQTKKSLTSLLRQLKTPWEELFGIELELSCIQHCACGL